MASVPVNGGEPVSISNSTTPAEYTSERSSDTPGETCSGER